jgi:hypothetical protein
MRSRTEERSFPRHGIHTIHYVERDIPQDAKEPRLGGSVPQNLDKRTRSSLELLKGFSLGESQLTAASPKS